MNQQGAELENFTPIDADFKLFGSIIINKCWMKSLKYDANLRYRIDKSLISFIACFLVGIQVCWKISTTHCLLTVQSAVLLGMSSALFFKFFLVAGMKHTDQEFYLQY